MTFPNLTFSKINVENCGLPGVFHIILMTFLMEEFSDKTVVTF